MKKIVPTRSVVVSKRRPGTERAVFVSITNSSVFFSSTVFAIVRNTLKLFYLGLMCGGHMKRKRSPESLGHHRHPHECSLLPPTLYYQPRSSQVDPNSKKLGWETNWCDAMVPVSSNIVTWKFTRGRFGAKFSPERLPLAQIYLGKNDLPLVPPQ